MMTKRKQKTMEELEKFISETSDKIANREEQLANGNQDLVWCERDSSDVSETLSASVEDGMLFAARCGIELDILEGQKSHIELQLKRINSKIRLTKSLRVAQRKIMISDLSRSR